MTVTVSLGRLYARSISSIFLLCMESNALEKSTNNSVAWRFFCTISFDDSTDYHDLRCCRQLSPKTVLIFPKNFLNLWFDAIEKQSIINLSCYGSNNYASEVLGDSEVTILKKGEDAVFCPSIYCIPFVYGVAKSK